MADVFTPEERSRVMSKVRGKDTKPEVLVRSLVHRMGFRFRLHNAKLPGKPDIVLKKHRKIIFVHGCFWHQHPGCKHADRPTSNVDYWNRKLDRTIERDKNTMRSLKKNGWKVLIIWECETKNKQELLSVLKSFLSNEF